MLVRHVCLALGAFVALATLQAAHSAQTLDAVDRGWYRESGVHTTTNRNYIVGDGRGPLGAGSFSDTRNFFVFDLGGITVEGIRDGTIRTCDMAGPEALFIDNKKLTFDGNNARADRVEFRNTANGKFGGLKITKTDFRTDKLVLMSPPQGKKAERLTLDKCYFGGREDLDTIRSEMLQDFENSESGVVAVLRDVCEQPNNFAGSRARSRNRRGSRSMSKTI